MQPPAKVNVDASTDLLEVLCARFRELLQDIVQEIEDADSTSYRHLVDDALDNIFDDPEFEVNDMTSEDHLDHILRFHEEST